MTGDPASSAFDQDSNLSSSLCFTHHSASLPFVAARRATAPA